MGAHAFLGNDRPTVEVELELQLVDAHTSALTGAVFEVMAGLPGGLRGPVRPEFLQCYVEVTSGPCRSLAEVESDLAPKLRAVAEAAAGCGARLAWGGTHPFSERRGQRVTPAAGAHEMAGLLQGVVRRPVTFGLRVRVGVESGDAAVAVVNRVQEHLPALLALSSNSPFYGGRATGLHAHRVELLDVFPAGGLPPLLRDWDDFDALVNRMTRCGFIRSEKDLWWDVRPDRESGTVEVSVCDMPADLPSALGLSALIQCLVDDLVRGDSPGGGSDASYPLLVRQNRWRAARFGLGAALVDHRTGATSPAWKLLTSLADRLEPAARRLGCLEHLGLARSMAGSASGAERQLAVFRRTRDLAEVVRFQTGDRHGSALTPWAGAPLTASG